MLRGSIGILCLWLTLGLIPAYADCTDPGLFEAPCNDISIAIVGEIFGTVSSGETYETVIGAIFAEINQVALNVGLILILYTLITGSINISHSGEILREKSGVMFPLRMISGVALLLPKANGFCIAQMIVYWMITSGIGAADSVWSSAVGYLQTSGMFTASTVTGAVPDTTNVFKNIITPSLSGLVCMIAVNTANNAASTPSLYPAMQITSDQTHIYFKDTAGNSCGTFTFSNVKFMDVVANSLSTSGVLYAIAQIAYNYHVQNSKQINLLDGSSQNNIYLNELISIAGSMLTDLQTAAAAVSNQSNSNSAGFLEAIEPYGWIVAGTFYRVLFSANSAGSSASDPTTGISWQATALTGAGSIYSNDVTNPGTTGFMDAVDKSNDIKGSPGTPNNSTNSYDMLLTNLLNSTNQTYGFASSGFQNALSQPYSAALTQSLNIINSSGQLGSSGDPMSSAVSLGLSWMNSAVAMIMLFSTLAPTASFGSNLFDCTLPFGAGVDKTIDVLQPVLIASAAFFYAQGALLGFYLPMIPIIIFMTSALGWLVSAIEAMVAAPLVAIGLAWPEAQSEVLGRAEPAVMLMLNLFLRPALMIVGFTAGLVLLTIALKLTNFAFNIALRVGGVGFDMAYGQLIVGAAYCAIVLTIVTRCFNLVHQLPDKVLMWIGDRSQGVGNVDDALNATKTGTEQGAKGASGMVAGSGKGAIGMKYDARNSSQAPKQTGKGTFLTKNE